MNAAHILLGNRSPRCVSAPLTGATSLQDSVYAPSLSDDGRRMAANCNGKQLLGAQGCDRNSVLFDLDQDRIDRVSPPRDPNDIEITSSLSGDGKHVAVCGWMTRPDGTRHREVVVHDLESGQTALCTGGNDGESPLGDALSPDVSGSGNVVVFEAQRKGLDPHPASPGSDVYAWDRSTGKAEPVSVSSQGDRANATSEDPRVSADGRYVVFASGATNLVTEDKNGYRDIFVRDRQQGTTVRVSVTPNGEEANGASGSPGISGDGYWVAFATEASNLGGGLCMHDVTTGRTEAVKLTGLDPSPVAPALSNDGRFVALLAKAMGSPNANVYVHDRTNGTTVCVSRSARNDAADSFCRAPAISGDGRVVAFSSDATNLAPHPVKQFSDQLYVTHNPLHPSYAETLAGGSEAPTAVGTIENGEDEVVINDLHIPLFALRV